MPFLRETRAHAYAYLKCVDRQYRIDFASRSRRPSHVLTLQRVAREIDSTNGRKENHWSRLEIDKQIIDYS